MIATFNDPIGGLKWTQVFYTKQETRFWAQEINFNQNGRFYRVQCPKNGAL